MNLSGRADLGVITVDGGSVALELLSTQCIRLGSDIPEAPSYLKIIVPGEMTRHRVAATTQVTVAQPRVMHRRQAARITAWLSHVWMQSGGQNIGDLSTGSWRSFDGLRMNG